MTTVEEAVRQDFPLWAVQEMERIYFAPAGPDQRAIKALLDQFPDVSEESKQRLERWAMFVSR